MFMKVLFTWLEEAMTSTRLPSFPTGTLVDLSFSMQSALVIWGCGTSSNPHRGIGRNCAPAQVIQKELFLGYDPANPLRVYTQRKWNQHLLCVPMFIAALFTITKMRKHPQHPCREAQIKKSWCIYTMEYYLALETKEALPFATTRMDLQGWVKQTRHRKRRAAWPYLYVGYKKSWVLRSRESTVVVRGREAGDMGRCWSKAQSGSYGWWQI